MTLVLALATGVFFGLAPALQVLKPRQTEALQEQGSAVSRARRTGLVQKLLVSGQVALSLVLLTAAGLLMQSLKNTLAIDPGFGLRQGVVVPLSMGYGQYSEEEGRILQRSLLEGVSALPGVESAAMASFLPLGLGHGRHDIRVEGYDPAPDERLLVMRNMVSPEFFSTMGILVVRGRSIDQRDAEDAPLVAMVNETMAERYWPGQNALGGRVQADLGQVYTVVGVFADGKYDSLTESRQPYLVLPQTQAEYVANASLVVRATGDPRALIPGLSSQVRGELPGVPPPRIRTISDYLEYSQGPASAPAFLVGVFGLLALLLASVGLYGVMAHSVSQRTREFGIRLAMGAEGSGIERLVLTGGLKIILFGMVVGSVLALSASQALASFLYQVDTLDPLPFLGAGAALLSVGLLASLLPARRASRSDPSASLRAE
jgi:predicted permease